jgi:hypothetical protein
MLALSPANASTEPPALISISLDANETLDPAYTEVRLAANKLIAPALSDRSSATSTDADSLLDNTDPPEDRDTEPLESIDALPVEADTVPPANASISSDADTDINDVVTAAENASIPIAPPETPIVSAPASIDRRAPTVTAVDPTEMLSPDDRSTEPMLDSCTPESPISTDEPVLPIRTPSVPLTSTVLATAAMPSPLSTRMSPPSTDTSDAKTPEPRPMTPSEASPPTIIDAAPPT